MEIIEFFRPDEPWGCFSNFSPHPIKLKGKVWPTTEHYFQAQKFSGTIYEENVRLLASPMEAKVAGNNRELPIRADWESVKNDIMREAVYAKFSQYEELKIILLNTGEAQLVERTNHDSYWGDGINRKGKNMLGIILVETRTKLKNSLNETSSH